MDLILQHVKLRNFKTNFEDFKFPCLLELPCLKVLLCCMQCLAMLCCADQIVLCDAGAEGVAWLSSH